MFTLLLITFEFAILYLAYWFVFKYEPAAYKVKEDIWGSYPGFAQVKSNENVCLMFSDRYPSGVKSERL
jgi:hypothetical protein